MDKDEMDAIIHRMMRDLDEDDHEPDRKPDASVAAPASRYILISSPRARPTRSG